jgi:hypothetical protein
MQPVPQIFHWWSRCIVNSQASKSLCCADLSVSLTTHASSIEAGALVLFCSTRIMKSFCHSDPAERTWESFALIAAFVTAGGDFSSDPMNEWLPTLAPALPSASGSQDDIDAADLMFDSFGQLSFHLSADFGSQGNSLNFTPNSGVTNTATSGTAKPRSYQHEQHQQEQQILQQARPDFALSSSPPQIPRQQPLSVGTPSTPMQPAEAYREPPQWQQVRVLQQAVLKLHPSRSPNCSSLPSHRHRHH